MNQILMIDDDEKLVALVGSYLEPQGFKVHARHDGLTGLEAARTMQPDLVILDLMLPGLDGLEVCRRMRETGDVPILMLTARGDETDRIVGLEVGADDYLAKPFNARELLARIRAILRRTSLRRTGDRPSAGATSLVAGPVVVDLATRTVIVDGREIGLTTAELDVLAALAANAGRVLSRSQLMEHIHGADWAAYDRSIDVHISRIRSKIEDDPRSPRLLKTVRGVGYLLIKPEDP